MSTAITVLHELLMPSEIKELGIKNKLLYLQLNHKEFVEITIGEVMHLNTTGVFPVNTSSELYALLVQRYAEHLQTKLL